MNVDIRTVVGGPHASVMPQTFFDETKAVDIVVLGEGEITFVNLVETINKKENLRQVEAILFRDTDGELVETGLARTIVKLDDLTLPAYDLINIERFFLFNSNNITGRETYNYSGSERAISMVTSRGCSYNCIFCSIHLSMGQRYRPHSAEYVISHIEHVINNFNVKHIHFEDDNLTFDYKRFNNILDQLIKRNINITWYTPNGIRADNMDEESLRKCKDSGCTYLRIGIESGSDAVRNNIIKKKLNINDVNRIAATCKKIGIDLEAFYIIGFPGETINDMETTINLACRLEKEFGVMPLMHIATPLYGTDLYNLCVENGFIKGNTSFRDFAAATTNVGLIQTSEFTKDDVVRLLSKQKQRHMSIFITNTIRYFILNGHLTLLIVLNIIKIISKEKFNRKVIYSEVLNSIKYKNCFARRLGKNVLKKE